MITQDKFERYFKIQQIGKYNMLDPIARIETGLSKHDYMNIINNYDKLYKEFKTPLVYINPKGRIRINTFCYSQYIKTKHVNLSYCKSKKLIRIKPTQEPKLYSHIVLKKQILSAKLFLQYHNIDPKVIEGEYRIIRNKGLIEISLKDKLNIN